LAIQPVFIRNLSLQHKSLCLYLHLSLNVIIPFIQQKNELLIFQMSSDQEYLFLLKLIFGIWPIISIVMIFFSCFVLQILKHHFNSFLVNQVGVVSSINQNLYTFILNNIFQFHRWEFDSFDFFFFWLFYFDYFLKGSLVVPT